MRPNLSLENLTKVLATLGAGAILAGCGGSGQDVKATEVPASKQMPWAGDKACAAHGCGAAPAASGSAAPTAPSTGAASGSAPDATPAAAATAASAATTSAPASPAPTSAPAAQATAAKPPARPAPRPAPKPAAGDASCGQGTCSADSKKKM